jgi:hypothetical protein
MEKPSILKALLIPALFVLVVIYGVISLSTDDPLWAVPYFEGRPAKIVFYRQGEDFEINPNDSDYKPLNNTLNDLLGDIKGFQESLGVSPETIEAYRHEHIALEVFYPEPVVIHSRFSFGRPTSLLIPFTGRHAQYNIVFGGRNGEYWPGALTFESLKPLEEQLATLGYWEKR